MTHERKKSNIGLRIFAYLRPFRALFIFALLSMVLFGASDGAVPLLIKRILDGVFAEQSKQMLYLLPIVLIAFSLIRAVLDFAQQYLMAKVGHLIVRNIRNDLNRKFLELAPSYFVSNSTGNILSRVTSDVLLVRTLLTDSVAAVIRDSIRALALLAAALYLDPVLALIAALIFPIGIFPVYKFGKKMRRLSKKGQEEVGALSSLLQESTAGNRVVRIFGREKFEIERFEHNNQSLSSTFIRSEKVRALSGPINEVLASFAISGVILYGGISVIGGLRTQGEFLAFLVAVFMLYDPFKKLSRVNNTVQQGLAGAERIFEILDESPSIHETDTPLALGESNDIIFDNVSFTYPGKSKPALDKICMHIKPGQKVALVGVSGAGKSTLIDLLPRFIDPQSGAILIGGVNIAQVALKDLRARLAMVSQHTFLFNDTIFNNIAYGNLLAGNDEVIAAAKAAFAYEFIQRLPKGFDTLVGEGGFSLSGGERQRISIARAILKNAPILILDEATAALDNKAESEVQSAIEKLEHGRTALIIAHRLSTVRNADLIMVMKEGRIVERGTFSELLQERGEFSKLHALQFGALENRLESSAG